MVFTKGYYGYQTKTSSDPDANGIRVNHFTWDQVEKSTRLTVDTVIFDCEGCWCDIVAKNKDKFRLGTMLIQFGSF